jgi:hypothetical protein
MIVYQLACDEGHFFEGWFASARACEEQATAGQLQCPSCGAQSIRKLPAAPHVHTSGERAPAVPDEARLRAMVKAEVLSLVRRHILENTEDVGREFPEVARRIHYREEEERAIRGQATLAEALELHEEGIEARVVPAGVLPADEVH